ncbi:dihydrolipoyl dehydrogenase family protein [Celeribacter litoreus]|uniref:dihydrolipoyl dehydrogenase family protein n=1 Tax=Celeribacter litoreus TaxID=2876714 RepID=UPI001CCD41C3|nr:FAD-dependent oxidoreductase [Celeribacter litoreus]MCA0042468.1 FAD-dependent oxidoreductase [Celeribacter litoreus]
MREISTDLCVIGAGSGGLSVAAGAVQMGAKVVLIEKGEMGGDCLNFGCVPSKSLLHASATGQRFKEGMAHVRSSIETIAPHDSQERFEGLGCTVIRAEACFTGPRSLIAGNVSVSARRFIVATGSRPRIPDIDGLGDVPYLTNETIWSLSDLPEHLLIIGGGPIGMEMAQAFRRFGGEVTVVTPHAILGREDAEAVGVVRGALASEGIHLREGARPVRAALDGENIQLTLESGERISGSHLLIATGRSANVEGLGFDAAGVEVDPDGIVTGPNLRTSNRAIYALGDVRSGQRRFTHVAGDQAGLIVRQVLFGLPAKLKEAHLPHATYTDPELAQVGLTEAAAKDLYGEKLEVYRVDYSGNDRAIATVRAGHGFLKLMVLKGRPVGVTIVGPDAGELIALWSLAISAKLKMSQIAGMVAPYPTLAELNKRAASAYFTPRLFENRKVNWIVRLIQKLVP